MKSISIPCIQDMRMRKRAPHFATPCKNPSKFFAPSPSVPCKNFPAPRNESPISSQKFSKFPAKNIHRAKPFVTATEFKKPPLTKSLKSPSYETLKKPLLRDPKQTSLRSRLTPRHSSFYTSRIYQLAAPFYSANLRHLSTVPIRSTS